MNPWADKEIHYRTGSRWDLDRQTDKCACGRLKEIHKYICGKCEAALETSEVRQAGKYGFFGRGKAPRSKADHAPSGATAYVLVWSDDPSWSRGGIWFERELRPTLEMGHMTPGTVFERLGRRYVVVGAECEPQRLEAE